LDIVFDLIGKGLSSSEIGTNPELFVLILERARNSSEDLIGKF
jgi:hypothetical protein